ncbi:MAG: hypothetical protein ACSHYB_01735 [Roseibacillus sp.]
MNSESTVTPVYSYIARSGAPRDIPMYQRTVYLGGNDSEGFHLWGTIDEENDAIDLSEILLEEALSSDTGEAEESEHIVDGFSHALGTAIARHITKQTSERTPEDRARLAVRCLLNSLNTTFTVEDSAQNTLYQFSRHPIREAADRTGIDEVELAKHTLHELLQNTVRALDPGLTIETSNNKEKGDTYTLARK